MEVNETNLCVRGVSLFLDASGQTFYKYSCFQFEHFSMHFILKTAVASLYVASCNISASGKTTGKMYDKNKGTKPYSITYC